MQAKPFRRTNSVEISYGGETLRVNYECPAGETDWVLEEVWLLGESPRDITSFLRETGLLDDVDEEARYDLEDELEEDEDDDDEG